MTPNPQPNTWAVSVLGRVETAITEEALLLLVGVDERMFLSLPEDERRWLWYLIENIPT